MNNGVHLYMCDNDRVGIMARDEKDGCRTTEIRQECEDSIINGIPSGVGNVPAPSPRIRDDTLSISRKDSNERNISTIEPGARSPGGIICQLISKVKIQLAYHKKQTDELEVTLDELYQFIDGLELELKGQEPETEKPQ